MADNVSASPRCVTPAFGNDIRSLLNDSSDMDATDDDDGRSKEELVRAEKRGREDSTEEEEGWTEIKGSKKKSCYGSKNSVREEKYEVYASSKERLPKQFALARILKENKIERIHQVKYLSPFKIRFEFECESAAQNLLMCEKLLEKGWRFQKAMQLSICYGLIKDVDLDFTDEEILSTISCPPPAKLLSFKRLDRRNRNEGGWCPSETLRLCFEGDHLPASVRVCDISIKVLPYIHQVSQCSQCWRLGHSRKMCPSKHVICPKCGGRHENCDTLLFSCVNCKGNHISLSRTCPIYKKERRLREIMAEFGCTYRKALDCYVPPEDSVCPKNDVLPQAPVVAQNCPSSTALFPDNPLLATEANQEASIRPTYADIIRTKAIVHKEQSPVAAKNESHPPKPKPVKSQKARDKSPKDDWMFWNSDATASDQTTNDGEGDDECPSFNELWSRIKEILFLKKTSVIFKIRCIYQLCLKWLTIVFASFISEWPWIKAMCNFFISCDG